MSKTIIIIVTLDTKGEEAFYIKKKMVAEGLRVLILDSATSDKPSKYQADVSKEQVAEASGYSIGQIAAMSRGEAIKATTVGLKRIMRDLYQKGEVQGAFSLGGADGALLASAALQELPLGVPKLIVSPIAQGLERFGPYVGCSDIIIMHSVIDILGVNQVSRKIFNNAVGAMAGMVKSEVSVNLNRGKIVGVTMYGNTTPAVMRAKGRLEQQGCEVLVFHPNGTGGQAMERLVRQGLIGGVLDMTTHEVTDYLLGGLHAGRADRLEAACDKGIPQVVVPGCVDFMIQGPYDTLPPEYKSRKTYFFNPVVSLVKTTHQEMARVAKHMAGKLNRASGPLRLMVPLQGFSMYTRPGDALHDPQACRVFSETIREHLDDPTVLVELDLHINDTEFADATAEALLEMMAKGARGCRRQAEAG